MSPRKVRSGAVGLLTALAFVVAGAVPLSAQATGTVRGQVTDAVTQRPLSGAQISRAPRRGGLANASGQFLVLNVPAGTFTVKAEIIGYGTQEQQVTVVGRAGGGGGLPPEPVGPGPRRHRGDGHAGPDAEAGAGQLGVAVRRVGRDGRGSGQRLPEMLQGRTPGLTLITNGGGAGDGAQIRLRGVRLAERGLEPVIYMDGVKIESGNQGGICGSGDALHASPGVHQPRTTSSAVEIIKGPAASTLYGAEAAAGVIQIITKKGRAGSGVQWSGSIDAATSDWGVVDTPGDVLALHRRPTRRRVRYPGCHQFAGT